MEPDEVWVTDITHIRTYESWLYLVVVGDLFSRKVVGWLMQLRITKELVNSDQGSQYNSHNWQSILKVNNLEGSLCRRSNRHDNLVVESILHLLKR
jgi:putative transposase